MKKYIFTTAALLLGACVGQIEPDQYVANMYAKGTLKGYEETGTSCSATKATCPGCHIKNYDRVLLTVDEVLNESAKRLGQKVVESCQVSVVDTLGLMNISESRNIPAENELTCSTVYEKEKSYLKSMGFAE